MDFSKIPTFGWVTLLILGVILLVVVALAIFGVLYAVLRKNFKTKFFELTEIPKEEQKRTQREMYLAEGKDQLENQCHVAKQLLKELRIKIYTTGNKIFELSDRKDSEILELISYRIVDRLNYDIRNDLTRNHITKKTETELREYSDAKAKGYFYMVKDRLFIFNGKLPEIDLSKIMHTITLKDFENIFYDIYSAARNIAGGTGGINNEPN